MMKSNYESCILKTVAIGVGGLGDYVITDFEDPTTHHRPFKLPSYNVDFYGPLRIEWEYSADNGALWHSDNPHATNIVRRVRRFVCGQEQEF